MLNTHLAHIVEVEDIIFVGKLAALLGLGCALDVLIGDEVIQHDGNVLLVEHAVKACLLKLVDGDRVVISLPSTISSLALMSWPALTSGKPACAARIFCVRVIPMVILSFLLV